MKHCTFIPAILALASVTVASAPALAPPSDVEAAHVAATPANNEALEEQLVGHWVLEGVLDGKQTTHDVDARWVLNREYVQIHEVSREKKADGSPQYEAVIYVTWNERAHEYSCLWLDSTAAADFRRLVIAHAKPESNKIPFIFNFPSGDTFHTTFSYDKETDNWEWLLEDHKGSTVVPFGRVRLTRKDKVNHAAD